MIHELCAILVKAIENFYFSNTMRVQQACSDIQCIMMLNTMKYVATPQNSLYEIDLNDFANKDNLCNSNKKNNGLDIVLVDMLNIDMSIYNYSRKVFI